MADSVQRPRFIIVMGVSGSGKTTIAKSIASAMDWLYVEGDDFHPAANVAKMAAGIPLTDDDRWPWLRAIGEWISEHERGNVSAVITCSALKRRYRDLLREGRPGVTFCHIDVPPEVLQQRLALRRGHYMSPTLLPSQLAALEPLQPDEPGVVVQAHGDEHQILHEVLDGLGLSPVHPIA